MSLKGQKTVINALKKSYAIRSIRRFCFDFRLLNKRLISFVSGNLFSQKEPVLVCINEQPPLLWYCSHDGCLCTGNMRGNLYQIPISLILNSLFSQISKVSCLCSDFVMVLWRFIFKYKSFKRRIHYFHICNPDTSHRCYNFETKLKNHLIQKKGISTVLVKRCIFHMFLFRSAPF